MATASLERDILHAFPGENPGDALPRLAALTFNRPTEEVNRDRARVARRIRHIVLEDPEQYMQHGALRKIRDMVHTETGWDIADISSALNLLPYMGIYVDRLAESLYVLPQRR